MIERGLATVCRRTILGVGILLFIGGFGMSVAPASAVGPTVNATFAPNPPLIDGSVGFGEWGTENSLTFPHGFIAVRNDNIRLYLLIDVLGDTTSDPPLTTSPWGDFFWATFDVNRDSAITPNVDLNYAFIVGTYNLRYQRYLGPSTWTGLQPSTRSSLAAGFGCFFGDGTITFSFPFTFSCTNHRVWELAIDLAEIGAQAGGSTRMGFRAYSQNPSFDDSTPAGFASDFTNLIDITLAATPVPVPTPTPGASVAFESDAVELTQAIQTRQNTLPLVANKATVARLYARTQGTLTSQPSIVYLYATRAGNDLPGSPLATFQLAPVTINRNTLASTANFLLPSSWVSGTVAFRGLVRDLSGNEQSSAAFSLTFTAKAAPSFRIISVNTGTATNPVLVSEAEIASQQSYLSTIYPLSSVAWQRRSWQMIGVQTGDPTAALNAYYLGLFFSCFNFWTISQGQLGACLASLPQQIYGFRPVGGGASDPTWIGGLGRVAYGFRGTSLEGTMAHEMNHNLDRSSGGTWGRHVANPSVANDPNWGCGATGPDPSWPTPPNNDNIRETGVDPRTPMTVVPGTTPDVMSYCPSGTLPTKWISPYRWNNLFNVFPSPPIFLAPSVDGSQIDVQNMYYVTGVVRSDGTGSLDPILIQPGVTGEQPIPGKYHFDILDSAGQLLASMPFQARFVDVEGESRDSVFFSLQVPEQVGAARFRLAFGDMVLDRLLRSASPPKVSVLAPNGGERWSGVQTIQWAAVDSDGDPLSFLIQYSPDDGASWVPIASNVRGTEYAIDTSILPGGTMGRIRVVATDGVNTAEDISDAAFSLARKPPEIRLLSPGDGTKFDAGASIVFEGDATDTEDAELPDRAFVWSYGDTFFGMGRRLEATLPEGEQTITLRVSDRDGNVVERSIVITVGAVVPPTVVIPTFVDLGLPILSATVVLLLVDRAWRRKRHP